MESVKFCWVRTCWMLVCLLSSSAAHSEHIHDVKNHQDTCSEESKWCSTAGSSGTPDVYEDLWQKNLDLAEQTLKLPFLQHMQLGDLQADSYTSFMIQDLWYLAEVTDLLEQLIKKSMPDDMKTFLQGQYKGYKDFRTQMLQTFNLNGVKDIKAIPAMKAYLEEYQQVLTRDKPIMFVVSLLPCSRLWVWLAQQLSIGYGNAYWSWKSSNMDGHPGKYKDLINKYLNDDKDVTRAQEIFRTQMQNEFNFFKASVEK